MSIVQRRPAPLAGSRDPYRSAPGARNDRYQDASYQSSSRNNPPPSAMPRSSNASAGIPSRSRSYSTASASDSLPGNPRRPAGMPSGPSSSRYANTSANNNNGYESDATAPRSRRSDIPARGRAAAPEGGNRARSASVGPASAPSRPSRSSARRSPEAEYETGDAYADQNTYSNRDAGGYNDTGGTSDVTGKSHAQLSMPCLHA
ncbi:hypothetical protein DL93DRAFT_2074980 [Clavulina sp. PMI_390]|nr:hypothetical protein DL93DRAFT_2074980 [Clavulina sp. PMI_390]